MFIYTLIHTWNLSDGDSGITQLVYDNIDDAFKYFKELQKLIETDVYDFKAVIPLYVDGDMSYSIYENEDSPYNRQDLILIEREVSC